MSKYVKLPALQGAISSIADNTLLDFDIPNYGYYNLAKSYMSVMVNVATTEVNPPVGIHSIKPVQANNLPLRNNVFIGDYDIKSDLLGSIDNLQSSNVFNCNMDIFARDFEQIESENYKQLAMFKEPFANDANSTPNSLYSMFRQLSKTSASQEVPFELKIPLKQFSSFCNTEVYNASAMGKLRVHTQFQKNQITFQENVSYPKANWFYYCGNIANGDARVTTGAYGDVVRSVNNGPGIANGDTIVIYGTPGAGGAAGIIGIRTLNANPAYNGGNSTTQLSFPGAIGAAYQDVSIWKLNPNFNAPITCDDFTNNTGAAQNYFSFTTTAPQSLEILRGLIGSVVNIVGTDLNGGAEYDTVLLDVQYESPYTGQGNGSKVILYMRDGKQVANGDTAQNINIFISNTKLMPPACANITNATGAPASYNQLTVNNLSNEELCLWVGKKVKVNYFVAAGYQNTEAIITAINNLTITFGTNVIVGLANGATASAIHIGDVPANSITATFSSPNLIVQQLTPQHNLVKSLSSSMKTVFPKFTVEVCNIPANTLAFNKLYNIEPNVKNLFAVMTNANEVVSDAQTLFSYRWRINNVDKTNRDIELYTGLELDNMISVMSNSSKALRNLARTYGNFEVNIPMCAVPIGQQNMVQLILNFSNPGPANSLTLYLFKESISEV